jgi:16S rRNA (guanine1207-N2)-methyltransferase
VVDGVGELIERNAALLGEDELLLIDPGPGSLAPWLRARGHSVIATTSSRAVMQTLSGGGVDCRFEAVPTIPDSIDTVVLRLPREKARLGMVLHACAATMSGAGRLWLAGENQAGIKSAARHLQRHFGAVHKLDSARHCGLFEARRPEADGPFEIANYLREWPIEFAGRVLHMRSLPGVFAHGRLDRGTALLLEAFEEMDIGGRVLDFACGCGVLGLSLLAAGRATHLTLLDDSAVALESARLSLAANGLEARILPSDGLTELDGRFDWIVSNPPFHRGVADHLEVAREFFRGAGTFLGENGRILVVFNRHLPYLRWLEKNFEELDVMTDRNDYLIGRAGMPGSHRNNREAAQ